jgi:hypothetical protein
MKPLSIEEKRKKKFCISYGQRFQKKKVDGHLHCPLVESTF